LGFVPNLYATFAHSRTALGAYLALQGTRSTISGRAREVVNLVVSQANACEYCLAAHTALGQGAGVSAADLGAAQIGTSSDARTQAALRFVLKLVDQRGAVTATDVQAVRGAGFDEAEVVELIAHTALNLFTNYLNIALDVPVDFPVVALHRAA
jgi:uncharacterized peroxidase-related enzyme